MRYWDKNPIYFQIFISILSFCFVLLGTFYFVKLALTVSDENVFVSPPSEIYISDMTGSFSDLEKQQFYDSAFVGSFVVGIDDIRLDTVENQYSIFREHIETKKNNSIILTKYNWKEPLKVRVPSSDLDKFTYENLTSTVVITYVYPNGVSDRAGLKPGDIVMEINNQAFDNIQEADRIIKQSKLGSKIDYLIRRNNLIFSKQVTLPKFGINLSQLLMMICGMFMIFLGEVIGIKRPRITGARITSLSLIIFGLVAIFGLIGLSSIENIFDHVFLVIANFSLYLALPLIIHSFKYFPRHLVNYTNRKWTIYIPYIIGLTFFFVQLGLNYGWFVSLLGSKQIVTLNNYLFTFYVLVQTVLSATISLIVRKKLNKKEWKQSRLIRLTYGLLVVMIIVQPILFQFGYYNYSDLIYFALVLLPISYLFTIWKYRSFDITVRLKRNYQYLIVSSALYTVFGLILIGFIYIIASIDWQIPNLHFSGTSIEVLKNPLSDQMHDLYQKILISLLVITVVVILWNVAKVIQEKVNLKYYRFQSDFRHATKEFSTLNTKTFNPEELSTFFLNKLKGVIKSKRVGIVLFKNAELVVQKYSGFSDETLKEYLKAVSSKLYNSLLNYSDSIPIDYLPDAQRIVLKEFRFEYLTPIWSKEILVGVILVGEKKSETEYANDDLLFLSAIAGQTSVAIENSLLYEDLSKQERFKHELEIARGIQLASLPMKTPDISGLDIAGTSLPALEVGGDFYDYLNGKSDSLTIVIGDVSGKGTSAALYMSKIQGIMRTLNEFDLTPKELFIRTNNLISDSIDNKSFITSTGAKFNITNNKVTLARAGHLPLYHYRSQTDEVVRLMPEGLMLGFGKNSDFENILEQIEIEFKEGDVLLFLTDGLLEARNSANQEFDESEIIKMLVYYNGHTAEEIKNYILQRIKNFTADNEQFDDMTLVVVKKNN